MFRLGNKTGKIGEGTACVFLMKQGYTIVDRNYWKKWGEIDIVAEKRGITHFVEVKAVSREGLGDVAHETGDYRPEENVHPRKVERMRRVIQTYLAENGLENSPNWQFDVVSVYLDHCSRQAKVFLLENVIL